MIKAIKIGVIATLLIYGLGLTYTYYSNKSFNAQVELLDVNKNGIIDGKELTKESKIIAQQMEKRKTTEEAVVVLIPVALILGLITFGIAVLFSKMKVINDNEINYSK